MAHKWRAYTGLGLLLLMLAQSLLHPSAAAACLCVDSPPFDGEFLGTVVRVEDVTSQAGRYPVMTHRIIFQVLNAWSGVNTSYVAVWTGNGDGACGASFDEGATYWVDVDRSHTAGWLTDICLGYGQIALTGQPPGPYDQSYADLISKKGEGVALRSISMDEAVVTSENPVDDLALLLLLGWGVFVIIIWVAVYAAYRSYHREPRF